MFSTVVDRLVPLRRFLVLLVSLTSLALLIAASSLLGYQTTKTSGYQRCLPAIIAIAFVGCLSPPYFLYCPPLDRFIKSEKISKGLRCLALELAVYGGIGAYLLVVTADLHADTPGLLSSCGGFAMCRMLTSVLALAWILFLFLALLFTSLLGCTIYLSARRRHSSPLAVLTTSFGEVDWSIYASRSQRRKLGGAVQMNQLKEAKLEEEERRMKAERAGRDDVFVVMEDDGDDGTRRRESSIIGGAY